MKPKHHASERGQALVLIVFAMVALLGFAALAIDGGMMYADRRHAQNAADAASLAGGGAAAKYMEANFIFYENFKCSGNIATVLAKAETAAIGRAGDNGFTMGQNTSAPTWVNATCHQGSNYFADKYIDITTQIESETNTSLIHFVFQGPVKNTVDATTRLKPRRQLAFGQAIVGLNTDTCDGNQNGVMFSGSSTTQVTGGGIFSNGCLRGNGTYFSVDVYGGDGVTYAGQVSGSTENINPPVNYVGETLPPDSYDVPEPDCDQVANFGSPVSRKNTSGTIPPGNYSEISLKGTAQLVGGGLYCMYGDFDTGNSDLTIDESNGKQGVTIFLRTGSFITTGNGTVDLSAPPLAPDPYPALPGILVYMARGNTGVARLRGNSASEYLGVVLAPDGRIDLAGTEDVNKTFHTQLIGHDVEISGNALVDINYQGGENYQFPTMLSLNE
jgi:hypothetical protein